MGEEKEGGADRGKGTSVVERMKRLLPLVLFSAAVRAAEGRDLRGHNSIAASISVGVDTAARDPVSSGDAATGAAAPAEEAARAEELKPINPDVVRDETEQYLAVSSIEASPQPTDEESQLARQLQDARRALGEVGEQSQAQANEAVSVVAAEDAADQQAEFKEMAGANAGDSFTGSATGSATGGATSGDTMGGYGATGITGGATGTTGGATGASESLDVDANVDEHADETSVKGMCMPWCAAKMSKSPEQLQLTCASVHECMSCATCSMPSSVAIAPPSPIFTGVKPGPPLPDADGALQVVSFQLLLEGAGRIRAGNILKMKQSVAAFCGIDPSGVHIESIRPVLDPALTRQKASKPRFRRRLLSVLEDDLQGVVAARVDVSVETTEANMVGKAINRLAGDERDDAVQSMLDLFTAAGIRGFKTIVMSEAPKAVLVKGGNDTGAEADAETASVPELPADAVPVPEKKTPEYIPAPGDVAGALEQAVAESKAVAEKSQKEAVAAAGGTAGAGGATGATGATGVGDATGGATGAVAPRDGTGTAYHGIRNPPAPGRVGDVSDILKAHVREKEAGHWRWVFDSHGGDSKKYPAEVLQHFGLHQD